MDEVTLITAFSLFIIFLLMALGVPVFAALGLAGVSGIIMLEDITFLLNRLKTFAYSQTASYLLTVIPLFILMGAFAHHAGIGQRLFDMARRWVGHLPGGLAIASILTSAGFAATSGSSVATAATVGSVALPEMHRAGYDHRLSTGAVAAGGVLGVLIPPSVLLIFYAALTEVSAGKMLMAGLIPGVLSTLIFIIGVWFISLRLQPKETLLPASGWKERILSLKNAWQVIVLFVFVLGGIYIGLVTPTEAGAIGAFVAFIMLLASKKARPQIGAKVYDSFRSSITTTVMILMTMVGAGIFSYFLSLAGVPQLISKTVVEANVSPLMVIFLLLCIYFPLGMFLDAFSMLVITLPIMYPTVVSLGFDPIWFGILCVKMCEIGLITPPVGLNVYVIAGIDKETPLHKIFSGAWWFVFMEIVATVILFFFPLLVTWLPNTMMGH